MTDEIKEYFSQRLMGLGTNDISEEIFNLLSGRPINFARGNNIFVGFVIENDDQKPWTGKYIFDCFEIQTNNRRIWFHTYVPAYKIFSLKSSYVKLVTEKRLTILKEKYLSHYTCGNYALLAEYIQRIEENMNAKRLVII